jgi:hypothetical protein
MSFTAINRTEEIFQAVRDLGLDGKQDSPARLPIEPDHTYRGLLFDTDTTCTPTVGIHRFADYESMTFEGRELKAFPLDKLTRMPR